MIKKRGSAQTTNIILSVIVLIILAFLGSSWTRYKQKNTEPAVTSTEESTEAAVETTNEQGTDYVVSYTGEEGKTAFELLQSNASDVQYSESEYGAFITGIDGVDAPEGYFWALYVNDAMAQVGASDLITSSTDQIRWQLDKIEY